MGVFFGKAGGAWEKTRPLLEEAFEGRKRVLGPEHPLTLVSKASLAEIDAVGNGEV